MSREQKSEVYRNLRQIGLMTALLALVLLISDSVIAANALPLGDVKTFSGGGDALVGDPGGKTIVESLTNLVGGFSSTDSGIIGRLRGIMAAVAIAMVVYSSLKMLLAQGEESKITSAKKGIYMGVLGLLVISLAGEVTKILSVNKETAQFIFIGDPNDPNSKIGGGTLACNYASTFLGGSGTLPGKELLCRVNLFNSTVKLVITFAKYLISGIAVYEIISSAYRIITLGSEASNLERDKKNLIFGAAGLAIIIFSESIIAKVFYKLDFKHYSQTQGVNPKIDISEGARQIASAANLAVSIIGPVLIAIIIGAAIMYMTSGGNEEKQTQAKRAIGFAAIGMLVVYGAFGLVSTVISGQFQ